MLSDELVELCKGTNFAAVTTLFPDGHPQTQIVWVDCDEEHVIFNTERHRTKCQNLLRDPRVTVMVWDADDPYRFIEVRGRVVSTEGGAVAFEHINKLAHQYLNSDYPLEVVSERVIVKVRPDRLAGYKR
jgi:PPOX class probable F420-dependent enzyme